MNTEQERADFEAWYVTDCKRHGFQITVEEVAGLRGPHGDYRERAALHGKWVGWQAGRAALQSQPTEAFPCQIIEADFETGTVTLEIEGKYTVSAGQKYLCNAPLQSQDREDAERYRWLRSAGKETERIVEDMYECALSGEDLDAAIDHARRAEGDGE